MADNEVRKVVYVIDRVLTQCGQARAFIDRYLAEYAPGARERGMTLEHVLVSPPIWFDDQPNTVTVIWSLPDPLAWWQMTWQGRPDPSLAQWWSSIAELVRDRSRSVAASAADVDTLCGMQGETDV
ncbi:hypothetical protein [Mycolicibacterium brisbanense]|uniref:Superfamily II DNA helicase n=1 Tax=Mycolicibacterium brisbanense TaxID=146020 RepID=A0A100W1D2_9MYCO|nr:hypothetical protein [Mycolicibacterium brisbanense]MCV7159964.1 hypothetical protein [Mycolicibacterium brisbanense]GAS89860.1 superfamily II DNA helicase [Mycolicibacterium brisbanense]